MRIERERKFVHRHFEFHFWNLNMRHHAKRMNTRIRAAGTVNAFDGRKNFHQRFFNLLLNAQADFLNLPARIIRSVVSDSEFEFHGEANRE